MAVRFRIVDLLALIGVLALLLGFFGPELRSPDGHARVIFAVIGIISTLFLVSCTPVWALLLAIRRRSRRGLEARPGDYAALLVAFALSTGIFVGLIAVLGRLIAR